MKSSVRPRGRQVALLIAGVMVIGAFVQPAAAQGKRSDKQLYRDLEARGAQSAEGTGEAGPVLFGNGTTITINDNAAATPYPSPIAYNWCEGTVTDVNASISGLNHTFPDDIDIVLQGPGGQSTILMSDVGGANAVTNRFLTFNDEAATGLPDSTLLANGSYKPTDFDNVGDSDTMPAPSPSTSTAAMSVFDGTSPTGTWNLFVRDDVGVDVGNIAFGWSMEITVTSAVSGSRVCIPHVGAGEPYPSQQTVSGLHQPITDLNVKLNGLSHTWPDDIDILLQGPGGQSALIMSDAGGDLDINNVNLTLDDQAAAALPDSAQITSGSYKPTNHDGPGNADDTFPPPAPAPSGTALSVFNGTNPNGAWKLFVRDAIGGDQGILSGWSLQITTPQATVTVKGGKVKEGKKRTFTITRTANLGLAETVSYKTKNGSAKKGKDYKAVSGTLTFAPGEASKKVKVKTKDDSLAERTEKFFLRATAGGVTSQGAARIKDND